MDVACFSAIFNAIKLCLIACSAVSATHSELGLFASAIAAQTLESAKALRSSTVKESTLSSFTCSLSDDKTDISFRLDAWRSVRLPDELGDDGAGDLDELLLDENSSYAEEESLEEEESELSELVSDSYSEDDSEADDDV